MPSLTIRDLPPELHQRLRESAERNRRSLNAEVISMLEQAAPRSRPDKEEILRRADALRARAKELGITFADDEEVTRTKNMGRL